MKQPACTILVLDATDATQMQHRLSLSHVHDCVIPQLQTLSCGDMSITSSIITLNLHSIKAAREPEFGKSDQKPQGSQVKELPDLWQSSVSKTNMY